MGITACLMLTVGLITVVFYYHPLYTNRLIFGREALEIRGAGGSRYAGMLGLKEYPASTKPGMFDGLLSLPFEADRVPVLRILVEGRRKDGPHPQAEPAAVVELLVCSSARILASMPSNVMAI